MPDCGLTSLKLWRLATETGSLDRFWSMRPWNMVAELRRYAKAPAPKTLGWGLEGEEGEFIVLV